MRQSESMAVSFDDLKDQIISACKVMQRLLESDIGSHH
jgi:hypothetical protein